MNSCIPSTVASPPSLLQGNRLSGLPQGFENYNHQRPVTAVFHNLQYSSTCIGFSGLTMANAIAHIPTTAPPSATSWPETDMVVEEKPFGSVSQFTANSNMEQI